MFSSVVCLSNTNQCREISPIRELFTPIRPIRIPALRWLIAPGEGSSAIHVAGSFDSAININTEVRLGTPVSTGEQILCYDTFPPAMVDVYCIGQKKTASNCR